MSPASCTEVEEMAAELAVGALSGAERAQALTHLKDCARCRDLVDDLAGTADRLLLLAPVTEPPVGFESRVADRVGDEPRPQPVEAPPRRRWMVAMAAAAAVVIALAGGLVGSLVTGDGGGERAAPVLTAFDRSERSGATCRAVVYGDGPAQLMVSLEGVNRDVVGDYEVEAVLAGASTPLAVGAVPVKNGIGALGATIDAPAEDIESIRVFWRGRVLYEADFHT